MIQLVRRYLYVTIFACIFSLCFISFLLIDDIGTVIAQLSQDSIVVDPNKIEIISSINNAESLLRNIYVSSNENVKNITPYASDLIEIGKDDVIPSSKLVIEPIEFDLSAGKLQVLNINIDASKVKPGNYIGNIFLVGMNTDVIAVPVEVTIHDTAILGFLLISAGVIISFILKIINLKVEEKDKALEAIHEAADAGFRIENSGNTDSANYLKGLEFFSSAVKDYNEGKYINSLRNAKMSNNLFLNSLTGQLSGLNDQESKYLTENKSTAKRNGLSTFNLSDLNPTTIREILSSISDFKRSQYIAYIGSTIIMSIIIFQTWNGFYPDLSKFGSSELTYVGAFLIGFAAQGAINEGFNFAKRRQVFN
jgi:hypothetical protein